VADVKLAAPAPVKGRPCPATLMFVGQITTNGPLEVRYTWASSDGRAWPEQTLKFSQAAVLPVRQTLAVPATSTGWMQLKVVAPKALDSTRANYSVTCGPPARK
jgi:hypothetical protein